MPDLGSVQIAGRNDVLPLTVLTFGLFLLVVNALMLWLVAALVPGIRVQGFVPALLGSLLLTLLNLAVASLIGPGLSRS